MINHALDKEVRQRAYEMWLHENCPDGLAERHWFAAEHEVTEEYENAAVSRWAAPVERSYVERKNEATKTARGRREASNLMIGALSAPLRR